MKIVALITNRITAQLEVEIRTDTECPYTFRINVDAKDFAQIRSVAIEDDSIMAEIAEADFNKLLFR